MMSIILLALSTVTGPGLGAPYLTAVMAWGRTPAIRSIQWCDAPGAASCSDMLQQNLWGWCDYDAKAISIRSDVTPDALQSLVSHEVGHCLGIMFHTPHGLMSTDWTPPIQDLPEDTDRRLLP